MLSTFTRTIHRLASMSSLAALLLHTACSGQGYGDTQEYDLDPIEDAEETVSALRGNPGQTVAPQLMYGGIWTAASGAQEVRLDMSRAQLADEHNRQANRNFGIKSLSIHVVGNTVHYGGVWQPNSNDQLVRVDRSHDEFVDQYDAAAADGLRLTELSTHVIDGQLRYSGIWEPGTHAQVLRLNRSYDAFLDEYSTWWDEGYRLVSLTTDVVNGEVRYHGVWNPASHGQYLRLRRTRAAFKREVSRMRRDGFQLVAVDTYTLNNEVYYNAIWNPGQTEPEYSVQESTADFLDLQADHTSQGLGLSLLLDDHVTGFSLDYMKEDLEYHFTGSAVGFSATIAEGNTMRAATAGLRRTSLDGTERASSADARMNMASVSKIMTAVGALKAMASEGIQLDDTIAPYLPPSWVRGPNIDSITFRELLTHRSGIRMDNPNEAHYEGQQKYIERGIQLGDKSRSYQNVNFGLFRTLIPMINGLNEDQTSDMARTTSDQFLAYMNSNVFAPAGIAPVTLRPTGSEPTLVYRFPVGNTQGTSMGDQWDKAGESGFQLSSNELAKFLVALDRGDIVPKAVAEQMKTDGLGWGGTWVTRHGGLISKGGYLHSSERKLHTEAVSFASGVQVGLLVNSATTIPDHRALVGEAYDRSWVPVN